MHSIPNNAWHNVYQCRQIQCDPQSKCIRAKLTCLVVSLQVSPSCRIPCVPVGHCSRPTPISPGLQHNWQRTGWCWCQQGLSPQFASKTESAVSHGCWEISMNLPNNCKTNFFRLLRFNSLLLGIGMMMMQRSCPKNVCSLRSLGRFWRRMFRSTSCSYYWARDRIRLFPNKIRSCIRMKDASWPSMHLGTISCTCMMSPPSRQCSFPHCSTSSGINFLMTFGKAQNWVAKPFVMTLRMALLRGATHFGATSLYCGSATNGL